MKNVSERIQALRKAAGMTQEELAERMGVSRQAVSKWESEQSVPELDKIVLLSEVFLVSTDYILKGQAPESDDRAKNMALASRVLYIFSVFIIVVGLFSAFSTWHEKQSMDALWGGLIIQAVGVAAYFIGRAVHKEQAPLVINGLNITLLLFMPLSVLTGLLFRSSVVAPYPLWQSGWGHPILFAIVWAGISLGCWQWLKKRREKTSRSSYGT